MQLNYKKELEGASKGMILIHDPKTLIKLIVRMIVRKVQIKHAAMILYDPHKDGYVVSISHGEMGVKIPAGFARFGKDSPLIKLFSHVKYKNLPPNHSALMSTDIQTMIWQESIISNGEDVRDLLHKVNEQMHMFNAVACVPAYFRDTLLALLLLGEKSDGTGFDQEELDFFSALASDTAMAIKNAQLIEDLKKEAERNRQLFISTTLALTSAIEAKDEYTRGHTERVTQFSLAIAHQMNANQTARFPHKFFENLQNAALLHDIGKIGIPEIILRKAGKLTDEEYTIMKQHPQRGLEILKHIAEFKDALDGVRYHHERYDGKGYPYGLKAEDIPIAAAIIAVADTFDAMTTDRPYRAALPKEVAMEEIKRNSGLQFNPLAVRAIVELREAGRI
ncbi:MAG TPA: HD domain-containing protein [Candidatus Omnitrophota bacterium]|nr:HD domain-containing protein [Candidatus Omnitrophota bacterium]HPD85631.1 HD domain-containing protein [Candidatus Omnitrophota bacterium]HRZ04474.1 HD domain-containing protein [Candidatus Omnitrophota bacterium]